MENPFESGHIKNYILLYAGVVVIVVLFFIASSLFNKDETKITKKVFNTEINTSQINKNAEKEKTSHVTQRRFKLLKETY